MCGETADRLVDAMFRASLACRSLSELTPWVKQLGFPIAPGVADFFTTQSNLDTVHDPGGWAALT